MNSEEENESEQMEESSTLRKLKRLRDEHLSGLFQFMGFSNSDLEEILEKHERNQRVDLNDNAINPKNW